MACCSSCDLSARFIDEAIRSARKLPSFSITKPSRTSLIGTNSCVPFVFTLPSSIICIELLVVSHIELNFKTGAHLSFLGAHGGAVFDVERPRKVFEPAF